MLFPVSDRRRHAFTLVELLVVIAIIGILMAISLIVGSQVISGGKARATADTLRVLDSAVSDYVNRVGKIPDSTVRVETDANTGSTNNLFPVFDGSFGDFTVQRPPTMNTVGLFLHQVAGTGNASETVATINPKYVRLFDPDGPSGDHPELMTVFDGWGRPIRYVHPSFDGRWPESGRSLGQPGSGVDFAIAAQSPIKSDAQRQDLKISVVRRNFLSDEDRENWVPTDIDPIGDSDGGICPAQRPYFYSPGEDNDPSTLDDNVYTSQPTKSVG